MYPMIKTLIFPYIEKVNKNKTLLGINKLKSISGLILFLVKLVFDQFIKLLSIIIAQSCIHHVSSVTKIQFFTI